MGHSSEETQGPSKDQCEFFGQNLGGKGLARHIVKISIVLRQKKPPMSVRRLGESKLRSCWTLETCVWLLLGGLAGALTDLSGDSF